MTLAEIKRVLDERNLKPLKQLGQNFLFDQNLCEWWVDYLADSLSGTPSVLEIGPGLGSLTKPLLKKGFEVCAIEKDRGLALYLRETLIENQSNPRFHLIEGDALEILETLNPIPQIMVGNLPYNITSPLLTIFLKRKALPQHFFLLVQKEFGERLLADSGTKNYGSLSVLFQTFFNIEKAKKVPPQVFYPRPEVDSLFIALHQKSELPLSLEEIPEYESLLRSAFSQRRKKIKNLTTIQDDRRAEELSVQEWIDCFSKEKNKT